MRKEDDMSSAQSDGGGNGMLEVKDLSKTFHSKAGDVVAVDGASFEARKGEVVVIVGPSGSGKTTLLYLIGSLESPDEGEISAFGEDICAPGADLGEHPAGA